MRTYILLGVLIFTILNGVQGSELDIDEDDIEIVLPSVTENIQGCYLNTPDNETIQFKPEDQSDHEQYQLLEKAHSSCAVVIKNIREHAGDWTLWIDTENRNKAVQRTVIVNTVGDVDVSVLKFSLETGEFHQMNQEVFIFYVKECKLTTPDGEIISFVPETEYDTSKYQFIQEVLFGCVVRINNVQPEDSGVWTLNSKTETEQYELQEYIQIKYTESTYDDKEEDNITWLTEIEHETKLDLSIDITLSNIGLEEDCYIIDNNGTKFNLHEIEQDNVMVKESSYFVSCRITLGPMNENLLGEWTLCGNNKNNDETSTRCQKVIIKWKNVAFPSFYWPITIRPIFNHPIHYGGSLSPVVIGTGDLHHCSVITPYGENLIILPESDYPSIKRVVGSNTFCSVTIGPFESQHLGEWILYGIFNSAAAGPSEIRNPMHFSLYNEENPYEQAYNVSVLDTTRHVVNIGNKIEVEVPGSGTINDCFITSVDGQIIRAEDLLPSVASFFISAEIKSSEICKVSIGPITNSMLGEWQMTGKFYENGIFTEKRQAFEIIKEDPENPIEEEHRTVQNLSERNFNVAFGSDVAVTISMGTHYSINNIHESCHVRTTDGLQYTLMEGFNVLGVEVSNQTGIACGINIQLITEDNIGDWILISRERSATTNEAFERRLPFNIYVEEQVNAVPNVINIAEGTDIHVRLENPTDLHETCRLIDQSNEEMTTYETDPNNKDRCAFIVRNISESNSGSWEIQYGNKIVYRAFFQVSVTAQSTVAVEDLFWVKDSRVDLYLGPEDAVFCNIQNPQKLVVFVGFSKCHLVVEKVNIENEGNWTMTVGTPGRVLVDYYYFNVHVEQPAPKVEVTSSVEVDVDERVLHLSCSVASQHEVQVCMFSDPSGRVMLASQGVGEDRYHGRSGQQEVSLRSVVNAHDCGLTVINPLDEDLGIWRCSISTEQDTYHGFLTVQHPWGMNNADDSVNLTEPKLKADLTFWTGVVGEDATLSCSIAAPIRYCYFRSSIDGKVIHVNEGMSSESVDYIGAGFDAGECSIRHKSLSKSDSGIWTCNVGFRDPTEPEQSVPIQVHMSNMLSVWSDFNDRHQLYVTATVHGRVIEYCRFVRSDGFAFTTQNVPQGYFVYDENHQTTTCTVYANDPIPADMEPWSVVVKISGMDSEMWKMTEEFGHDGDYDLGPHPRPRPHCPNLTFAWLTLTVAITLLVLGGLACPKKNREWARERAVTLRNSFRKVPLTSNSKTNTTNEAA